MARKNKNNQETPNADRFNATALMVFAAALFAAAFLVCINADKGIRVLPVDAVKPTPIVIEPVNTPEPAAIATPSPKPVLPAAIYFDGEQLFVLKSEAEAQKLLDAVLKHYSEARPELIIESVAFAGDVRIAELDASQMSFALDYATAFEIAIKPESRLKAELTAKVKEYSCIAYNTTTKEDGSLLQGTRIISVKGREGLSYTISRLKFVNNEQVEKSAIEEGVVYLPVDEIILKGIKKVDANAVPGRNEGEKGKPAGELKFIPPTEGSVAVNFGGYKGSMNLGIIYSPKAGSDVVASADGTVTYAANMGGYGLTVEIDHGGGFVTRYAHMDTVLKPGDRVAQGFAIGTAGMTGNVEKTRLRFEIWIDGRPFNPRHYIE